MVNLILAQRAYEVNSKAVQAADEMMQDQQQPPALMNCKNHFSLPGCRR